MENASVFENLHFLKGDGHLNYYLYNWVMNRKHINAEELAVVLFWWFYLKIILLMLKIKNLITKFFNCRMVILLII